MVERKDGYTKKCAKCKHETIEKEIGMPDDITFSQESPRMKKRKLAKAASIDIVTPCSEQHYRQNNEEMQKCRGRSP